MPGPARERERDTGGTVLHRSHGARSLDPASWIHTQTTISARTSLCEYMAHLHYIWVKKIGRRPDPERRPLEGARTRHQRPPMPLPDSEARDRAALVLWATPVHASSMVESTADETTLPSTVTQMFVVSADRLVA